MTNRDIMVQILSEASGFPMEEIGDLADRIFSVIGSRTKIDDHVPDDKAAELLANLRKELPGVRRWLVEGNLLAEADIAAMQGKMH